jgi:L-lysine 2,3-aminomutase
MPYYIFHYAPYTLGRSRYGLSIRDGCELLSALRRTIPGPAFPKYTLFHIEGKHDIPLDPEGTPTFQYTFDNLKRPIVRFKNWKGNWVTYPDLPYDKVPNKRVSDEI